MSNPEETKTAADIIGKNAIEREKQKDARIAQLEGDIAALGKALEKSNAALDSINRASMIPIIRSHYNLPEADINNLATDTMADMVETTRILKPTHSPVASVRPGVDEAAQDSRFTVPKKFKYGKEA